MAKKSEVGETCGGNRPTYCAEGDSPDGDPPQSTMGTSGASPDGRGEGAPSGVELDIAFAGPDGDDALRAWLVDQVERALVALGVGGGRLSVAIVDDAEMARLHEQYKDEPGTTDVLTFDLRDEPIELGATSDRTIDGEVVVCREEAARQAARRGHEVGVELLLYIVHGVLHLLGYDDHDADEAARMHAREDAVLVGIGVGAAFARGEIGTECSE